MPDVAAQIQANSPTLHAVINKFKYFLIRIALRTTGHIKTDQDSSTTPIVEYLERKLHTKLAVSDFPIDPELGIREIDSSII
ncbi:MAG: hypothetical protein HQK55_17585, partial [Deltaproteobacteria bacterium]|nr:hypothetical protein [Deltaproteobacteria bacterium]